MTQQVGAASHAALPSGGRIKNPPLPLDRLDSEWSHIQNMAERGIIPSPERIKDYLLSCYQKSSSVSDTTSSNHSVVSDTDLDKVLSCIADILRLEEDYALPTEQGYRDLLVLLESEDPAMNLQFAQVK